MSEIDYKKELLYQMAIEQKNIGLALEILERICKGMRRDDYYQLFAQSKK